MATLYVAEFSGINVVDGKLVDIVTQPPVAEQTVSYTTTTQSSAFNAATRVVRIHTDSICSIAFGANPTATTSKMRMVAGQTEYFGVSTSLIKGFALVFGLGVLGNLGLSGGLLDPAPWALSSDGTLAGRATLDIDFVNGRAWNSPSTPTIASLLTCTRATPAAAYYTKADGTLTTFAANAVRYGTNGLLVEEARTNLILHSQDFSSTADWPADNGATASADVTTAPDGTLTADKLIESAANGQHYAYAQPTLTNTVVYAWSAYLKAAERTWAWLYSDDAGVGRFFDLTNGVTGGAVGGAPTSSSIVALANGWYRCSVSFTSTGGTPVIRLAIGNANNGTNYTGDGASGIYAWGAQLEVGAFTSSYVPTTTASVARAADVVTLATSGFGFNAAAGTIYSQQVTAPVDGTQVFWQIDDTTANERYLNWRSTATITRSVVDGGVSQVAIGTDTVAVNTSFKHAFAYTVNDFACSIDGAAVRTDVSGTLPTVTTLRFGRDHSASYWNSYIKRLAYWNTRLTNGALVTLST